MIHALPTGAARTLHVADLSHGEYDHSDSREATTSLDSANVVSSIDSVDTERHWPVLDIDVPALLIPSSTPGHSHLYIDVSVPAEAYWRMCDAMAEAGILQPGYVSACRSRGYTSVRLPWVTKEAPEVKEVATCDSEMF